MHLEFIAKRVLSLSKLHNYSDKIILNYLFSNNEDEKSYFITFSKPAYYIKNKNYDEVREKILFNSQKKYIMLTSYDESGSQIETLKLIDYVLSNFNSFKKTEFQKIEFDRFEFEYNYVYSISLKEIDEILSKSDNSNLITKSISTKIYRDKDDLKNTYFISYFSKNNMFFPYVREREKESVLDTLSKMKYYSKQFNNVFIFKDQYKFNLYTIPFYSEKCIIKRDINYNEDKDFDYSEIVINEILTGVFLIKYAIGNWTFESSLFTIDKGMIEKKLSKYEHHPEIKF